MATLSVYNEGKYNDGIYNLSASGTGFFSVTMNGQTQYFAKSDMPQALGLYDEWTIAFWIKFQQTPEARTIFSTSGPAGENLIQLTMDPISQTIDNTFTEPRFSSIATLLKGPDGSIIKHVKWGPFAREDEWTHGAITYSGGDLTVYASGISVPSGTSFVNVSGTSMTDDPPRAIYYGTDPAGNVATISGNIGHLGTWSTALSQEEVAAIADLGFPLDLTTTSGGYASNASLRMYYRPGEDETDFGRDYSGNNQDLDKIRDTDLDDLDFDVPDQGGL
jgi:hypothetical protein